MPLLWIETDKSEVTRPRVGAIMDDLINMKWRGSPNRPHMSIEDRAKIFLPFAALKGYEEAVEDKQRVLIKKAILSQDEKEKINNILLEIEKRLNDGTHPISKIVYFKPDEKDETLGEYAQISGMVAKIDVYNKSINVVSTLISLDDIREIEILD